MTNRQRKYSTLRRDWRYALVVCLGLAIPAYCIGGLTVFSAAAHLISGVLFLAGLFAFGRSYVLADVIPILLVVIVLALAARSYQSVREHERIQKEIQQMQESQKVLRRSIL